LRASPQPAMLVASPPPPATDRRQVLREPGWLRPDFRPQPVLYLSASTNAQPVPASWTANREDDKSRPSGHRTPATSFRRLAACCWRDRVSAVRAEVDADDFAVRRLLERCPAGHRPAHRPGQCVVRTPAPPLATPPRRWI